MILVFDVGNTNMVLGVYEGKRLIESFRLSTESIRTADEYGMTVNGLFEYRGISLRDMEAVIISSVVPNLMYSLEHMARKYCGVRPLVVGPGTKTGMNIKFDNPREVGADRIVNGVAAFELYGGCLLYTSHCYNWHAVSYSHCLRVDSPRINPCSYIGRESYYNAYSSYSRGNY